MDIHKIISGWFTAMILTLWVASIDVNADEYDLAKQAVMNQQCLNGENVDQLLNHKHRNLYLDLGWRVIKQDDGSFVVDRSFRVSKAAEIHYRWRVYGSENLKSDSNWAERLCLDPNIAGGQ